MRESPHASLVVRIARKTMEAEGIASFVLVKDGGGSLPAFDAGSHIDVTTPCGLVRQYSLCSAPQHPAHYEIAVLCEREGRGGSLSMHRDTREGDTLSISVPRNHFPLDETASTSILLAGGIGVTPLLAMAERLSLLAKPFSFHCCSRTRSRTAFLERLAMSSYARHVHLHMDDGADDQRLDIAKVLGAPDPARHLYVCGPAGFLAFVRQQASQLGWQDAQVHFEYFGAPEVAPLTGDQAFDVVLQRSGKSVRVEPGQTIVQAVATLGIDIPTSCAQGVCGTCETRVLAGLVDHRDVYFTDAEKAANDRILPCCSRAASGRLVLDI